MKDGRGRRGSLQKDHSDLESALTAMTAEELRAFVLQALEQMDDEPRETLKDFLISER